MKKSWFPDLIVPLGNDIGYLPGDKERKIGSLDAQPIFDNLNLLMMDGKHRGQEQLIAMQKVEKLVKSQVVELEVPTYICGRSIPNQYLIVDEAQNLTPHEIKSVVSRAGEGTKIVLTGDPNQIDNPYLDSSSNGLTYTVERLKSHAIHGHVTLAKSERSSLAAAATELL